MSRFRPQARNKKWETFSPQKYFSKKNKKTDERKKGKKQTNKKKTKNRSNGNVHFLVWSAAFAHFSFSCGRNLETTTDRGGGRDLQLVLRFQPPQQQKKTKKNENALAAKNKSKFWILFNLVNPSWTPVKPMVTHKNLR